MAELDFCNIVHPLRQLTKNGVKWEWTDAHQSAFNELKSKLTTDSIRYYDPELTSRVIVDASPVGIALVFAQHDQSKPDLPLRVVKYLSRTLSDVETRYSQVEKEALAVVWACEKLHLYLIGGKPFEIVTDNKAVELIYGNPKSQPKARIVRWFLRLLPYNLTIVHRPGVDNPADFLSRNPVVQRRLAPSRRHG